MVKVGNMIKVTKFLLNKFGMDMVDAERVMVALNRKTATKQLQIRNEAGNLLFVTHIEVHHAIDALKRVISSPRTKNKEHYVRALKIIEPLGEK